MSITAAVVRELMAAGLQGDALIAALQRIERDDLGVTPSVPAALARRREYDRQRKAEKRISGGKSGGRLGQEIPQSPVESPVEKGGTIGGDSLSLFAMELEDSQKLEIPDSHIQTRARRKSPLNGHQADFDRWYAGYPRKKSKGSAEQAFVKALRFTTVDRLMAATATFSIEAARRPPDKVPYPASWLNAKGWEDEPDRDVATGGVDHEAFT